MEAILNDALDELDDSDDGDDVNDNPKRETGIQPNETVESKPASFGPVPPPPTTGPTASPNNEEEVLAESFQKMFQDLANDESAGEFGNLLMQHLQSAGNEKGGDLQISMEALLSPEQKPSSQSSSPKPSSSTSGASEEELLQGLFQNLMAATNDPDESNKDNSNIKDSTNLEDVFGGIGGDGDLSENLMDAMMEQLLSKELMYEPIKQVTNKFPSWLESNKDKLSNEEWNQRNKQYECFQKLVEAYEQENSTTEKLLEFMQRVQEYGQPPPEIINEIAPGLQLDKEGIPNMKMMPGMMPGMGNGGPDDCRIM